MLTTQVARQTAKKPYHIELFGHTTIQNPRPKPQEKSETHPAKSVTSLLAFFPG